MVAVSTHDLLVGRAHLGWVVDTVADLSSELLLGGIEACVYVVSAMFGSHLHSGWGRVYPCRRNLPDRRFLEEQTC